MQKMSILPHSFNFLKNPDGQLDSAFSFISSSFLLTDKTYAKLFNLRQISPPLIIKMAYLNNTKGNQIFRHTEVKVIADENPGELPSDEDEDLCPVECVREFRTDEEFLRILEKAKELDSLVVVDFYRTSCGSCKYIEQGFSKLCKGSGDQEAPVIFLKHNVMDEYDEQSEVAERLRIRAVPLFHFYKNGVLLEAFATRDKERIDAAILRYSSPTA